MWGRGSSPFTFLPGTGDFTCLHLQKSECPAHVRGVGRGPGVSNDWCISIVSLYSTGTGIGLVLSRLVIIVGCSLVYCNMR